MNNVKKCNRASQIFLGGKVPPKKICYAKRKKYYIKMLKIVFFGWKDINCALKLLIHFYAIYIHIYRFFIHFYGFKSRKLPPQPVTDR